MKVITPTPDRTVTTPNAAMESLATPSLGSTALSTWRVRLEAGRSGPVHAIDREQVWMVISGSLTVTCDGRTETAAAGQAVLLPPDVLRRLGAAEGAGDVEALVAMEAGGSAVTEDGERHPLPWAE